MPIEKVKIYFNIDKDEFLSVWTDHGTEYEEYQRL